MNRNYYQPLLQLFFVFLALLPSDKVVAATDLTSKVNGAACDDLSYWHLTDGVNGKLQFTQSGRGSTDGSGMEQPFPEYWISAESGQTLDNAEIRHDPITGLPAGHYRLTLRIRCYDERGTNQPSGAWLYANGKEVDATSGDYITNISYKGQPGCYGTVAVEFDVESGQTLEFGINVRDYNATWVAWKDVTLHLLSLADGAEDNMSRGDRLQAMANGLTTDATWLVSNPTFAEGVTDDEWAGDFSHGAWNHYGCAEVWYNNFDVSQTLSGVPNGLYELRVLGFYRYNNSNWNSNSVALQNKKNNQQVLLAEVYANGETAPLQDIADPYEEIADMGYPYGYNDQNAGLPFSMANGRDAFDCGLYDYTTVQVEVTNHELTIGLRKNQCDGADWTLWDDVQLELLQPGDNSDYHPAEQQEDQIPWDEATRENPVDATTLIKNPSYTKGKNSWNGYNFTTANKTAEVYYNTCYASQIIDGLPNGFYRVSANGFYRYGDIGWEEHDDYNWHEDGGNNVWAMYTIPYSIMMRKTGREQLYAKLFANNEEVGLPSIFDYVHSEQAHSGDSETELGYVPGSQQSACEAFEAGDYPVSVEVLVTDGTLSIGVSKQYGYKNDWACWSNFRLEYLGTEGMQYVEQIQVDKQQLDMVVGEKQQLTATLSPATASNKHVLWGSSNQSIVTIDANGLVEAKAEGDAYIYAYAAGSENVSVYEVITVSVGNYGVAASKVIINEIQVSNVDMFVDPSYNYGGYVELYNPTNEGMSLNGLWVSFDPQNLCQYQLNSLSGSVPAKGYGLIWFDYDGYGMVKEKPDMEGGVICISDVNGNLLASQSYPAAIARTSYARTIDGGSEWAFTAYPTPGASNSGSEEFVDADNYERLPLPVASQGTQLFTGSASTTITIPEGATLRYTTDGTTPTHLNGKTSSDGQFNFDKTTVLRLRLYESGKLPSPVKTLSFIKRDRDYMLPVLSVVGNPDCFYDNTLGVFVPGTNGSVGSGINNFKCNWNMDWNRPVAFDYLSANGDSCYSQEASLERFGGWSRSWYPYNFKLKSSSVYEGKKYMTHAFFGQKPYLRHKTLQVRNGGNDLRCRIKDASLHQIILTSGFYLDCMDWQPVHVFINGEYIGMENLREPSNKHFAYANYGIDTDEMDQMKLGSGVGEIGAGNANAFWQWYDLSYSASDESVYEQICEMVDVDEFINYMAAEAFLGGDDWPTNNCKAFKGNDGKFHIVFFDVDQALRYDVGALNRLATYRYSAVLPRIFFNMLNNDTFRRQFVDSYSLVAGSVFEPERSHAIIDRMSAEMNPALALEDLSTQPTAQYIKEVLTADRRDRIMESLHNWSYAGLSSSTAIRTKLSSNIGAAQLLANGLPVPTGRFDGTFFSPMTVQAVAPEGYTFTGWKNESTGTIVSTNANYVLPTTENMLELTATFQRVATSKELEELAMPVKINEVSAGNSVYANEYFKHNDWFELFNNTDTELDAAGLYVTDDVENPLKYQIPNSTINTRIPAGGHLIVWADDLQSVSQLHANFKLSNTNGQVVLVSSSDQFVANNAEFFASHPAMTAFVDGLTYDMHRGDETVGRFPDGGFNFYRMTCPTIEKANTVHTYDVKTGEDQNWMEQTQTQYSLPLAKGWNWISHPLRTAIATNSLSENAQRIVGRDREAIIDSRYGLTGTLHSLDAGNLYKVLMTETDTYRTLNMAWADAVVSLMPGWNWMGYPVNGSQTLSEALSGCPVEDGDQLLGQDGFATYANGTWTGSLTTLETGKGYLYKTARAKTFRLHKPSVAVNYSRTRMSMAKSASYGIDKYAYPNVMGVIATIEKDGEQMPVDDYTLLAYSGDECRGVAKWVDSLAFLTIYGQGNETISYRAIDHADGTVYCIEQTSPMAATILGTTTLPVIMSLGTVFDESTGINTAGNATIGQGRIVGYYTMSGTFVARRPSQLSTGVYVAKYSDGTFKKITIQ